jgi:hypothetical protein
MKDRLIAGFIGGLGAFVLIILALVFFGIYDYVPISILNPKNICDNFGIDKMNMIRELSQKGILLTPDEYTSHILGYYNTIITTLIASFVVFSFIGYFSMKSKMREQIQEELNVMLRESKPFQDTILSNINGRIEQEFVLYTEFDDLVDEVNSLRDDLDTLDESGKIKQTTTTNTTILQK